MQTVRYVAAILWCAVMALPVAAQVTTAFRGRPVVKVSENGVSRVPERLSRENAANLECVISKIGDSYYWASRENVPVVRIEKDAFVTYVALTGVGYVKTVRPELKDVAALLSDAEAEFDYVEHMTLGLSSVTYFGKIRP